jgi:putative spermidine/putrescine transport system permease protein
MLERRGEVAEATDTLAMAPAAIGKRRARASGLWLLAPALLFLCVFYVVPLVQLVLLSVDGSQLNFAHYREFFSERLYLQTLGFTLWQAFIVTLGCLVLGYPLAYAAVRIRGTFATAILLVVAMAFWTSFLVRTYAWMVILGGHGPVAYVLSAIGFNPPPKLLFTSFSATLAMIHILLPFMVMALYSVMDKINADLLRAAAGLGARPFAGFRRVFLPLSLPGVVNGCAMVFIFAVGFYVTPVLLGSPREQMLAGLIGEEIQALTDWGGPAAMAVVLFSTTMILFVVYNRFVGLDRLSA